MGLNVWILILLAIALSGAAGYIAGQSRVWKNSSERICTLRRAYEERLRALVSGASGSRPSPPRTLGPRLGPAPRSAASVPEKESTT